MDTSVEDDIDDLVDLEAADMRHVLNSQGDEIMNLDATMDPMLLASPSQSPPSVARPSPFAFKTASPSGHVFSFSSPCLKTPGHTDASPLTKSAEWANTGKLETPRLDSGMFDIHLVPLTPIRNQDASQMLAENLEDTKPPTPLFAGTDSPMTAAPGASPFSQMKTTNAALTDADLARMKDLGEIPEDASFLSGSLEPKAARSPFSFLASPFQKRSQDTSFGLDLTSPFQKKSQDSSFSLDLTTPVSKTPKSPNLRLFSKSRKGSPFTKLFAGCELMNEEKPADMDLVDSPPVTYRALPGPVEGSPLTHTNPNPALPGLAVPKIFALDEQFLSSKSSYAGPGAPAGHHSGSSVKPSPSQSLQAQPQELNPADPSRIQLLRSAERTIQSISQSEPTSPLSHSIFNFKSPFASSQKTKETSIAPSAPSSHSSRLAKPSNLRSRFGLKSSAKATQKSSQQIPAARMEPNVMVTITKPTVPESSSNIPTPSELRRLSIASIASSNPQSPAVSLSEHSPGPRAKVGSSPSMPLNLGGMLPDLSKYQIKKSNSVREDDDPGQSRAKFARVGATSKLPVFGSAIPLRMPTKKPNEESEQPPSKMPVPTAGGRKELRPISKLKPPKRN
ncbi:uncharacterized protein BJ171DRAFT_501739 [Polychytrium aggregatum]|uniref:uncharacterized protein n=1 Tax=Polychytrium aggregatum TaxID=110093 RepID=UPI0022FDC473|nr:uncharacterized protein BJ171DRAFT_501739 [Polychytrium aggregatum]KAI9205302.1 hypothetical protein BJ171DRAFT_501739 [Polychytrium aggregatum]